MQGVGGSPACSATSRSAFSTSEAGAGVYDLVFQLLDFPGEPYGDGAFRERPEYHASYHGAYLADPDGTNVEAAFHDRLA